MLTNETAVDSRPALTLALVKPNVSSNVTCLTVGPISRNLIPNNYFLECLTSKLESNLFTVYVRTPYESHEFTVALDALIARIFPVPNLTLYAVTECYPNLQCILAF